MARSVYTALATAFIGFASMLSAFPAISKAFAVSEEYRSSQLPQEPYGLAGPRSEVSRMSCFSPGLFGKDSFVQH